MAKPCKPLVYEYANKSTAAAGESKKQRGGSMAAPVKKWASQRAAKTHASFTDISPAGRCLSLVLGFSRSISLSAIRLNAFANVLAPRKAVIIQKKGAAGGMPREAKKEAATANEAEKTEWENITMEL
jgi:hypothetical protein